MIHVRNSFVAGLACLSLMACRTPSAVVPAAQKSRVPKDEITAALPVIPGAKFNLADFGAVGDYKAFDTDAFKNAIAAIARAGGGHLIVPAGTYKTLPFTLTSRMDLHLEAGATIKAPSTFREYGIPDPSVPGSESGQVPTGGRTPPLISGDNLTDVAITGTGTIDGSGAMFWLWSDKAARRYPPGRRIVFRPYLVSFSGVKRLHVDGVTLTSSPMFHLVPRGEDMTIENLRIVAPSDAPNTDAIDPSGTRIVIRNCEIDTGDDNVALHSGSRDILVENLTCLHGHGISIGSGTRNGLSHVIVRHCNFNGTDNGLRIKSYRGNGGEVHDIRYSDIVMQNVRRPFDINMLYNGNAGVGTDVGPREAAAGQTNDIPNFFDIHFANISVTNSRVAGRIIGVPEQMPHDITFSNVKIQAVRGFLVQDAKDISFNHVQVDAAVGDSLVTDNAAITWNGSNKTGNTGGSPRPFY